MAIKRAKLNYMPAVPKTPPAGKIVVPSRHMEKLDRAILEKVRQNEAKRIASIEDAYRDIGKEI